MEQSQTIKSYVILGGGTAGWMSAAILARALEHLPCKITLIESPHVSSIGVGEATIPSMIDLLAYLNIPLADFILKTNSTFKLAIKFVDWLEKGQSYWHPFGYIGNKIDGLPFYQHWLKHAKNNGQYQLTDFSPSIALAQQNNFFIPDPKQPSNLSSTSYALHFDATLVADYLMNYCKDKGVEIVKDHLTHTQLNAQGYIEKLTLESSKTIEGDFYFDCSGQKALLINKALRVGYQNWQSFLPVNKAVAMQTEKLATLPPYTESIAEDHGWRWRIPLQSRTGNGYVFCSDFCSDNQAIDLLVQKATQDSKAVTEPRLISFTTGKRDKMWVKNCVAIGLSSGFLEPLESTSIYLIMRAMLNFVQTIPNNPPHPATINEFNRLMDIEYECIRDFIVLHYCETKRTDTDFWRMWQNLPIPDSLNTKLDLFKSQGRLYKNQYDLFSQDSWYAVLEGMKVRPQHYDPLVDKSIFDKIEQAMQESAFSLQKNAKLTLSHNEYLDRIKQASNKI